MLQIKKLNKSFDNKKVVVDVSFSVNPGEVAIFLGASGVGKSTLLRILNNLEHPNSGTIELDGKPLDMSVAHRQQKVGMVFQSFNLFPHLTVEENITLALEQVLGKSKAEAQKIAYDLLKKYDLLDKKDTFPAGLSGGQKQRLALMRTLAVKPAIVCLDEPTSALDPMLTNYVAQTIMKLAKDGYIVLVATHDTTLLDKLDCTINLMKDGTIIETAPSKLFFKNKKSYPHINAFVLGS